MAIDLESRFEHSLRIDLASLIPYLNRSDNPWTVSNWANAPVRCGNREMPLERLFHIRKTGNENLVHWRGRTGQLDRLGYRLQDAKWKVHGDVGNLAANQMESGSLEIDGNAGDWLAADMTGGNVLLQGNAGNFTCASREGQPRGINGGCVVINGNAGSMSGRRMRRGTLAVAGDVQPGTGWEMRAGTLLVGGQITGVAGFGMRRGTLIVNRSSEMIPDSFAPGPELTMPAWPLISRQLVRAGYRGLLPGGQDPFQLFHGPSETQRRGELWMFSP